MKIPCATHGSPMESRGPPMGHHLNPMEDPWATRGPVLLQYKPRGFIHGEPIIANPGEAYAPDPWNIPMGQTHGPYKHGIPTGGLWAAHGRPMGDPSISPDACYDTFC